MTESFDFLSYNYKFWTLSLMCIIKMFLLQSLYGMLKNILNSSMKIFLVANSEAINLVPLQAYQTC